MNSRVNTNHKKTPNHGTGGLIAGLIPDQQVRITKEGSGYLVFWFILLGVGLYHQINLILLISGLAAGPLLASWFASARMLSKLKISRRITGYVFAGERLAINYSLENNKRGDALALVVNDSLEPIDSTIPGARTLPVRLFFPRIPSGSTSWQPWSTRARQGESTGSGRSSSSAAILTDCFSESSRWLSLANSSFIQPSASSPVDGPTYIANRRRPSVGNSTIAAASRRSITASVIIDRTTARDGCIGGPRPGSED